MARSASSSSASTSRASATSPSSNRNGPSWTTRIDAADLAGVLVLEPALGERTRASTPVDADLLGQLALGGQIARLAGGHHAARGDVPPPRVDVLVVGATVHQQPAVGRPHDDRHRAVQQVLGAHPRPRDHLDDRAVGVDVLDQSRPADLLDAVW